MPVSPKPSPSTWKPKSDMDHGIPSLKARLGAGEVTIGSWLSFAYSPLAEIMTSAGFDWLVVDMEHTGVEFNDALNLIQVIELAGCVPLVRVGANDPLLIKRSLDSGAHGVVVPSVNSVEEAERAVDATYYPPRGRRGAGLFRAQRYGLGFDEYKTWADRETVLAFQIEHIDAVARLEEIVALEGVDAFMVGPYDLSASMGLPGQFEHPDVVDAMEAVRECMRECSTPGGYHVVHSNPAELARRIDEGYRFIAYGDDMVFIAEKVAAEAATVAAARGRGS